MALSSLLYKLDAAKLRFDLLLSGARLEGRSESRVGGGAGRWIETRCFDTIESRIIGLELSHSASRTESGIVGEFRPHCSLSTESASTEALVSVLVMGEEVWKF
jgi:hypothetical protein